MIITNIRELFEYRLRKMKEKEKTRDHIMFSVYYRLLIDGL
jgi:hypothetical protein